MKTSSRPSTASLVRRIAGGLSLMLIAVATCAASPAHLGWAEDIALNVTPDRNEYGTNPNYIRWNGVNGATGYENRTECSSFVTRVLKQAYGWNDTDFRNWMGSSSPTAAKYHDTIVSRNGFEAMQSVADIQAGDLIAVKYPQGASPTGHVMLAVGPATQRTASAPVVEGTTQYEVEVIDSTKSGHGPSDTRKMEDGTWDTGAGVGILRLYADGNGVITGYSWSTYSNSVYYDQNSRHLVVGKLIR
ncbi:MAG TPA: hypothetical protein VI457_05795 [Methylococcaceae bacterium]|nr:hypothetical protein [Methylococcaceae bacterium]